MSQMTSAARVGARALNRPTTGTPRLRVVKGVPLRRGDATFGIVCAILLAAGLIGLLLLNTSMAQGSFTLHDLRTTSDQLADTQGILTQSLDASKSPANLATRASAMGMVPAGSAAFLRLSDGKVIGVAEPAVVVPGFTVVRTIAPVVVKPEPATPPAPGSTAATVPAKPSDAAPAPSAARPAQPASDAARAAQPATR